MSYRFVLPVLPVALMFSGYSLAEIASPSAPESKGKRSLEKRNKCTAKMGVAILFLLASNIPVALYMSLIHQVFPVMRD